MTNVPVTDLATAVVEASGVSPAALVAAVGAATFVFAIRGIRGLGAVMRCRRRVSGRVRFGVESAGPMSMSRSGAVLAPWLVVPGRLADAIVATGIPVDPQTAVAVWAAAVLGVSVIGLQLGGLPTALVAVFAAAFGGIALLRMNRHRRQDLADRALPILLESVARALRAGASLSQAVVGGTSSVADTALAEDVTSLRLTIERGAPLATAFDQWARNAQTRPKRLTANALSLVAETGGAPGTLVDAVAQTIRDRDRIEREAKALSTQARSSAVVVAVSPLAFTAVVAMADPNVGAFLFRSPIGLACLVIGLSAEGVGAWWMSRLTGGRR